MEGLYFSFVILYLWVTHLTFVGCLQCYSCKASGSNEMDANIRCLEKAYLESCDEFYNYYNDVEEELYDYYYNFANDDEDDNSNSPSAPDGRAGTSEQDEVGGGEAAEVLPGKVERIQYPPGVVPPGAREGLSHIQVKRRKRRARSRGAKNSTMNGDKDNDDNNDENDEEEEDEEDEYYDYYEDYDYDDYDDRDGGRRGHRGRGRGGRGRGRGGRGRGGRGRGRGGGRGRSRNDYEYDYDYYEEDDYTTTTTEATTTTVATTAKPPPKPEHYCYSVTEKTGWESYTVEKGCKKIQYCKDALANKPEWAHPWNFCCDRSRCNVKLVKDKPQRVFGMGCRRTDDCIQGHNTRPVCPHFFKSCPRISRSLVKMECRSQARTMASVKGGLKYRSGIKEKKCYCSKSYFPKGPICTNGAMLQYVAIPALFIFSILQVVLL